MKLDGDGAKPLVTRGAVVTVTTSKVTIEGTLFGDPSNDKAGEIAKSVTKFLKLPSLGPEVLYLVDEKVPWSTVAPLVSAAAAADHPHVTFVFAAPGRSSRPPASSIDADVEALDNRTVPQPSAPWLPDLSPNERALTARVFKNCPLVDAEITGPLGSTNRRLVFDTGAEATTLTPEVVEEIGYKPSDGHKASKVHSAIGEEEGYWLRVAEFSARCVHAELCAPGVRPRS